MRHIRTSKTFSKFRALRSSACFEVPCASKFRVGTLWKTLLLNFHLIRLSIDRLVGSLEKGSLSRGAPIY